MKNDKLNVLLAKTDTLATEFKNLINNYGKFFSKSQGAFLGEKRTYVAKEGTIDEPNRRGNVAIQTTMAEKITYFIGTSSDYINSLFSQEKTNSSGVASSELIVDDKNWGIYTSLELLRLKGLLENSSLGAMISTIPVRSDAEQWDKCSQEAYTGRDVFESPIIEGTNITSVKEDYILKDPNVDNTSPNYNAVVAQKTTVMELGEYSVQKFSGQWSQRQKADALRRRSIFHVAVIEALKRCNDVETVKSDLTSEKIFGYIFDGQ